jgi:hypothetical protein
MVTRLSADLDDNMWGRPSFPQPIPTPTMPQSPYQPRPGYTAPKPYQQPIVFVHPVFNLEKAIQPFRGINNETPLQMCLKAYEYCEQYVMKHSVDVNGNPIPITVSYKTLFREARAIVHNDNAEIPLQIFNVLYKFTRKSDQHCIDSNTSVSMFNSHLEWTDDWEPESCHIHPRYIMNARMTKGSLIIVGGVLAKRIPAVGQEIGSGMILYGLNEMREGYLELPEMPSIYKTE